MEQGVPAPSYSAHECRYNVHCTRSSPKSRLHDYISNPVPFHLEHSIVIFCHKGKVMLTSSSSRNHVLSRKGLLFCDGVTYLSVSPVSLTSQWLACISIPITTVYSVPDLFDSDHCNLGVHPYILWCYLTLGETGQAAPGLEWVSQKTNQTASWTIFPKRPHTDFKLNMNKLTPAPPIRAMTHQHLHVFPSLVTEPCFYSGRQCAW